MKRRRAGTGCQTGIRAMRNKCECPKGVKRAVRAFARTVKMVADMADLQSPYPLTEYHWKEYLDEMEYLLLQQLLTSFPLETHRERLLEEEGLGYLIIRLRYMAENWEHE